MVKGAMLCRRFGYSDLKEAALRISILWRALGWSLSQSVLFCDKR